MSSLCSCPTCILYKICGLHYLFIYLFIYFYLFYFNIILLDPVFVIDIYYLFIYVFLFIIYCLLFIYLFFYSYILLKLVVLVTTGIKLPPWHCSAMKWFDWELPWVVSEVLCTKWTLLIFLQWVWSTRGQPYIIFPALKGSHILMVFSIIELSGQIALELTIDHLYYQ